MLRFVLWAGVRGGEHAWAGQMMRILTCRAHTVYRLDYVGLVGKTSLSLPLCPPFRPANVLARMSKSVEQPMFSSFAVRWPHQYMWDPNNSLWLAIARIEKP